MEQAIQERIQTWLDGTVDQASKAEIRRMQQENPEELADAFFRDLEFGTGGLRGLMGIGTNRMNRYTVGIATQGFANYLRKRFQGEISVVIAHDSRNNSRNFAEITAHVMAANGIKVYLFENLRPTPELSYSIRFLKAQGGVVCTASHNPKEYNGYKAYWDDGAQLVEPHDRNVMAEVSRISGIGAVNWSGGEDRITLLGKEMDEAYWTMAKNLSVYPGIIARQHDLKIVYTPIHGTGITLVPGLLERFGFTRVHIVAGQAIPDGNFPTVIYPNPEESEAMNLGLREAKELDADILLGTDPDADRVGVGVKDREDNWLLLNGNQTAVLVFSYLIEARKHQGLSRPEDYVCKTIVTTDLIDRVAKDHDIGCYNVLTGFKFIADLIRKKEGKEHFIVGGEESYGLMIGDQVRDKDAVSAVALLCEMAAFEREQGRSLYEKLIGLYQEYGCFRESLKSLTRKGRKGAEEIAIMMQGYRSNPPREINGSPVRILHDYLTGVSTDLSSGRISPIELPQSNVLQFILADGSKISARPSGTEPKIKFYFSVNAPLNLPEDYPQVDAMLKDRIAGIIGDMQLT